MSKPYVAVDDEAEAAYVYLHVLIGRWGKL